RQKHPLPLDCSGGQCQSRCTVPQEDSLLLTRYLMIWMVIFVIIAVIVIVLVTRKREERRRIIIQKRSLFVKHPFFEQWKRIIKTDNVKHLKEKKRLELKEKTKVFQSWENMIR
ncbi:MAG TPA: hypothetical protein VJB66_02940, partial [Candidatus Nanoarchaeia archaeon]|nr:hypothetical protein [Candidatus Nanoarchaeia archaeon]